MDLNKIRSIISKIDKGQDIFGSLVEYGIDICLRCPAEDFGYCGLRDEEDKKRIKQCRGSLNLILAQLRLDTKITRRVEDEKQI